MRVAYGQVTQRRMNVCFDEIDIDYGWMNQSTCEDKSGASVADKDKDLKWDVTEDNLLRACDRSSAQMVKL